MKIYNVKMVKTEMARGRPSLCRNQKSFQASLKADDWWVPQISFSNKCFCETPYCTYQIKIEEKGVEVPAGLVAKASTPEEPRHLQSLLLQYKLQLSTVAN